MSKTFNIYCDESTHLPNDGKPYMLLGYVSVAYPQLRLVKEQIRAIMRKYKFEGELKWTNVHTATLPMYQELVDYFFMTDLRFRVLVVPKEQIDSDREGYTYDDFYFKMYYQLLHHKLDMNHRYNLYFDIKDTCSYRKLSKLKEILSNNVSIHCCQFVRSNEVLLLQLADVLMGAINYHLCLRRGMYGEGTKAKLSIVSKIQKHNALPLEYNTPRDEKKMNRFFITLE